ncbi:Glutamate synthase [NADPH] small chain [Limihaloglobus sulfuriphilus]|uniref:Glutamate synthase [NADPH] small chain n=1 Tax=Limihaloglobus sulfuriphilus TaxID=1851148 RepID=A0A1Q2MF96_9BACT|nr:NADPH-dependent glutamate synthase [Limihaloglobus sulfuriphilus]AQQ71324.1 Glutamate synthase [NADPH] small chain [Limihaloglobus sulfuriphilus]
MTESKQKSYSELREKQKNGTLKNSERLKIPPQEMPAQEPDVRKNNVEEVALGYTEEEARLEAMRCIQCKNAPCVEGCPVRINIKDFVGAIADGDDQKAMEIIQQNQLLAAVCGRVCPQEIQCQAKCTVGLRYKDPTMAVSIGRLERFVADKFLDNDMTPKIAPETGKKVAVVGSGPGGIVVAGECRRAGHDVTIFEAFHKPGGVMVYGIPEFRLPKALVQKEIDKLIKMGVKLECNFLVGRTRTVKQLMNEDGFQAVYIGVGAGLPKFMNIEGEQLVGVYSANEYLTRANLMKAYDFGKGADTPIARSKKVAVFGGGNVAMDSARTALRLGAEEVYLIYRRSEAEMPARIEEIHHAKEEGVKFLILQNPKRILGDDKARVRAVECLRYELGEPDDSGRRRPVPIEGSEFEIEVDTAIVAIGNGANPLLQQTTPGLKFNKWGNIEVDDNCKTSIEGVYAGGDIVLGAATVILAMGQGRIAAQSINEYLKSG